MNDFQVLFGRVIPAYVDANVLIRLANSQSVLGGELFEDMRIVYSSVLFEDLRDAPEKTIEYILSYLKKSDALFISNDGDKIFIENADPLKRYHAFSNSPDTEDFEHALKQLALWAHGSGAKMKYNQISIQLSQALLRLLENVEKEVPALSELSILKEEILHAFESTEPGSPELEMGNLGETFGRPDVFSGFSPPGVIAKILAKSADFEFGQTNELFASEPSFEQLVAQSATLSVLRFARDKGIKSKEAAEALKSIGSEIRDDQHIAFALFCPIFLTGDKGAAKKAFALAEFHERKLHVLYQNSSAVFSRLTAENWNNFSK